MQKVILSMMVVLFSTSVMANKAKVNKFSDDSMYELNINTSGLVDYLALNSDQSDAVIRISEFFEWQLGCTQYKSDDKQQESVRKAVLINVKSMKKALTAEQYKKYLRVLNVTLQNKGLWDYAMASK